MNPLRSVEAIATASDDAPIDWPAAADAAKALIEPGALDLSAGERTAYAADVRDAQTEVSNVADLNFSVPDSIQVQNRHHWIDANITTFSTIMAPLEDRPLALPGLTSRLNTATMATLLSFLGKHVLGQYDPLLLADGDTPQLFFVHPNIQTIASELNVDYPRFRRWIVFHEVTHAAEFAAAPWLTDYLETRMAATIDDLADGQFNRDAFHELDTAMTAVEGYAELIMDHAFDDEYRDLRAKVDARRQRGGPLTNLVRRLLGLGLKRRQYERGKAFFTEITAQEGIEIASTVWTDPAALPTDEELDNPAQWIARVH